MYAMDHTTHFEHRIESRPSRRFLRRAEAASPTPTASSGDQRDRSDPTPWPFPEFAD
jgi:hypothetical protein